MAVFDLPPARFTVSGHQPTLFGNAGYWSKMHAADVHLVTCGVPYRRNDHLGRIVLPSGTTAPLPLIAGRLISDVVVIPDPKFRKTLTQSYGATKFPYRHRLEPLFEVLGFDKPVLYVDLWEKVFQATLAGAGIGVTTHVVRAESPGDSTHARLLNRVKAETPECVVYLMGPGGLGYLEDDRKGIDFRVHRMTNPSPLPFLHAIVTMERPVDALAGFTLEEIPSVSERFHGLAGNPLAF